MPRSTESSAPWAVRHNVAFRRLIAVGSLLTAAIILVPLSLIETGRVNGSAAVALAVFSAVSAGLILIPVKPRLRRALRSTGDTKTDVRLGPGAFNGGKFGPNASQVARFLNGVASLSSAQWEEVQQAELLHDASVSARGGPIKLVIGRFARYMTRRRRRHAMKVWPRRRLPWMR